MRPRIVWTLVGIGAVLGSLVFVVDRRIDREKTLAALPVLPDLSRAPAAMRTHLTDADRVARERPLDAQALGALGTAYHADLYVDEAVTAYALAEQRERSSWRWTYRRAVALGDAGDASGMTAALRRVTERAPGFGPAWWRLGETLIKARDYTGAGVALQRALDLPEASKPGTEPAARLPLRTYAAASLARLALLQSEPGRAVALLEPLVSDARVGASTFRLLAEAYSAAGRESDAERVRASAEMAPVTEPYREQLTRELLDETRNATALLRQASQTDVSLRPGERERLLRRAGELAPNDPDAVFELATLLRVLRRYEEALALFSRHEQLVPGDFQALADKGRCLSALQRYGEAEAVFRTVLGGLDDANTRYDLGLVLDRTNRVPAAVAQYRAALERNPSHGQALNNLGVALARTGDLAAAEKVFQQLVRIRPRDADAHANLGAMELARGSRAGAEAAFQTALQLEPGHTRALEGLRALNRSAR